MENPGRLKNFSLDFRHSQNSFDFNDKQMVLAQNIHRSFGITEKNILRLIAYTGYTVSSAARVLAGFNYNFIKEVSGFLPDARSIRKVSFTGETKSLDIMNGFIAQELFNSLLEIIENNKSGGDLKTSPALSADENVKMIATELLDELKNNEKLSSWRALCVIGYIFLLYDLKLENEDSLLSEADYRRENKITGADSKSYLNYLSARIKNYVPI